MARRKKTQRAHELRTSAATAGKVPAWPARPDTFGRYGRFAEDGRSFIVTDPNLPRPWMNVLSNGTWGALCSHLGGGYSFYEDPKLRRITRWHVDGVPRETVGRFVYVRDDTSRVWWCANGYPPTRPLDAWECRHGLGYTTVASEHEGIATEVTYFVPVEDSCELWLVTVENATKRTRRLSLFEYVEFGLGNYKEEATWREFYILFNRTRVAKDVIYATSTQWVKYDQAWQSVGAEGNNIPLDVQAVFASSRKPAGCETDRYAFVGRYRDMADPAAVADGGDLDGWDEVEGRDACGAMQHKLTLKPGQKQTFVMLLGAVPRDAADAAALTDKYLTVAKARAALKARVAWWDEVLGSPVIETPDADLNRWCNVWLRYQAGNLAWWSRNVGYCYMGIYGYGTRDECQDLIAHLPSDPDHVRHYILTRLAVWMYEDGRVVHSSSQTTQAGDFTNHSDDPVNLMFIVSKYVRETGDVGILDEPVPYYESGGKTGSLYEHCMKGWRRLFSQVSERGLPLMLSADWNDALDQAGHGLKGESHMLPGWACAILRMFIPIARRHGQTKDADWLQQRYDGLVEAMNRHAWDGKWYTRGTADDGTVLGSSRAEEGKIWANPQSWSILGGIADEERTRTSLQSMDRYLTVSKGSLTFWPAFTEPDPHYGVISRFAPGTKENGAVFSHNLMWRLMAETYCGRGDIAWGLLKSNLPTTLAAEDPDLYKVEPYVQRQYTYAPMSQCYGEGSHSWATGAAMWNWHVVLEGFMGIQPDLDGLRIDPCFPTEWKKGRVLRRWRGAEYEILIHNPDGVEKGVREIKLDGQVLDRSLVPVPATKGERHTVEVTMG